MYNPKHFRSNSLDEAFALMDTYPFATVISVVGGEPMVSHLPLTPSRVGDRIELTGHCARANPHWKVLGDGKTLAVFQGAHTFISPQWYAQPDVPSWNYAVVHAIGSATLVEDEGGIVACLQAQALHVERHWPSGWQFAIPPDLAGDALARHIVAFRIAVEALECKRKLSQNRSAEDRAGVRVGLGLRGDENSRTVLEEMERAGEKR